MPGRRFLLFVAVLMGITALAASLAPREGLVTREPGTRATPVPTATAPSGAEPELEAATGSPRTLDRAVDAHSPAKRIEVREGDTLVLEVSAREIDSVVLEGIERIEPVEPESPARFEVLMDDPGSYDVRLLDAERRVATIDVRPAA
jgi:hypothetical protein